MGVCATAALAAVSYLAWRAAALPYLPHDALEWTARRLPVFLLASATDATVSALELGLGDASGAASAAEHCLAIGAFVLIGAVLAGALFTGLRRTETIAPRWIGCAFGMLASIVLALVHVSVDAPGGASTARSVLWILVALPPWGLTIGWSFERLVDHARAAAAGDASIERVDRRRFLARLGGTTALIAVAAAAVARVLPPADTTTSGESP